MENPVGQDRVDKWVDTVGLRSLHRVGRMTTGLAIPPSGSARSWARLLSSPDGWCGRWLHRRRGWDFALGGLRSAIAESRSGAGADQLMSLEGGHVSSV